jgi:deoxycytidine triphosphate deaminase
MPIAEYLRDGGYKVIEAVNSEEAMTIILHQETVVHLVFMTLKCREQSTDSV